MCEGCRVKDYLNSLLQDPQVIRNLASLALDMPVSTGLQYLGTLENIIRLSKQRSEK